MGNKQDKKRLQHKQEDACACVCVLVRSENSGLPTELEELCPDSDEMANADAEVLGCWKKQQVGCKNGRAEGSTAPCHSSVHGCSPREAAAVPAGIKFGSNNNFCKRPALALVSAPDVLIQFWMHVNEEKRIQKQQ